MKNPITKQLGIIQQVSVKTLAELVKAAPYNIGGGLTKILVEVTDAWDLMLKHKGFLPGEEFDRTLENAFRQGIHYLLFEYEPESDQPKKIEDFFADRTVMEFGAIDKPVDKATLKELSKQGYWAAAIVRVPLVTDQAHFEALIALRGLKPAAEDALFGGYPCSHIYFTVIGTERGGIGIYVIGRPMTTRDGA
jgi:hypothetical protein